MRANRVEEFRLYRMILAKDWTFTQYIVKSSGRGLMGIGLSIYFITILPITADDLLMQQEIQQ